MAKTTRAEMRNFVQKKPPEAGSTLIGYTYAPTDNFLQTVLSQQFLQDEITQIRQGRLPDGRSNNDDFYRTTGIRTKVIDNERRQCLSLARELSTKTDQPAVIRLVARAETQRADRSKEDKASAPLLNVIPPYTKFFLESVNETRTEKAQIIETFGEFIAFFFGRRPEVYNFSGRLLNTRNHDWKNDFQEVYDNFLRGTKAVENNATVFIQYDDVISEGFLMASTLEYHGITNNECPFNFSMLVTRRAPIYQLQRLRDRRARSRFTAAEEQLLASIDGIRDQPVPFSIIQRALSDGGALESADIMVFAEETSKIIPSSPTDESPAKSDSETIDSLADTIKTTSASEAL